MLQTRPERGPCHGDRTLQLATLPPAGGDKDGERECRQAEPGDILSGQFSAAVDNVSCR